MNCSPYTFASGIGPRRRNVGMSLVEVLVALVSTSVGLLGIAALQLATVRNAQEANVRLQATALASSMLDRMRANPDGFHNGDYSVAFDDPGPEGRAGADIAAWQTEIDRTLPGDTWAAGAIERQAGTNVVIVTLRWNTQGNESAPGESRASLLQVRSEI